MSIYLHITMCTTCAVALEARRSLSAWKLETQAVNCELK